ncbi:hypothetical protein QYF36_019495 [Acer negundo]|nr:hypothetical protein QYF36_019495 [Acer negundo]
MESAIAKAGYSESKEGLSLGAGSAAGLLSLSRRLPSRYRKSFCPCVSSAGDASSISAASSDASARSTLSGIAAFSGSASTPPAIQWIFTWLGFLLSNGGTQPLLFLTPASQFVLGPRGRRITEYVKASALRFSPSCDHFFV